MTKVKGDIYFHLLAFCFSALYKTTCCPNRILYSGVLSLNTFTKAYMSSTTPLYLLELATLFNAFLSNEAKPGLSSGFCLSVFTIDPEDKLGVVKAGEDTKRQSACILFFAIFWHIFS